MADSVSGQGGSRSYGWLLLGLLLVFLFRVVVQLIQAFSPVTALPSFDTWQSGAVPYPLLVVFQITILIGCGRVVWSFLSGTVVPSGKKGRFLLIVGWTYFIVMGLRLLIGLTVAPDHFWFVAIVPTIFHLVLACFLLVSGSFHTATGACSVASIPEGAA